MGTATLSTPVGAPSLGNYIFSGLQTRNYTSVLVGCLAAAMLALLLDGLVRLVEVGLRRRRRALVALACAILGLLAAFAVAPLLRAPAGASAPEELVNEVVAAFEARYEVTVEQVTTAEEHIAFNIPRELRDGAAA